jgi:lysophospholipase L1-like esterase
MQKATKILLMICSRLLILACLTGCSQNRVLQEQNDWSSIWIEHANQSKLPRMLFVGDSITDGYYPDVSENLSDRYYGGWYTTSKFINDPDYLDELKIILRRYQFDVIQVNNGLHGWEYSLDEYQQGVDKLVKLIKRLEPSATVVWVLITPVRQKDNLEYLDPLNQQAVGRNEIARKIMEREGIPVIDLYSEMLGHPEYYKADGFHFNSAGKAAQIEIISSFYRQLP